MENVCAGLVPCPSRAMTRSEMGSSLLPSFPYSGIQGQGHGFQVVLFSQWGWRWAREGKWCLPSLGSSGAQWTGPDLGVRGWALALLPRSSTSCVFLGKPSASPPQTGVTLQAALVRHSHTVKPEPDHGCENVVSLARVPPSWPRTHGAWVLPPPATPSLPSTSPLSDHPHLVSPRPSTQTPGPSESAGTLGLTKSLPSATEKHLPKLLWEWQI